MRYIAGATVRGAVAAAEMSCAGCAGDGPTRDDDAGAAVVPFACVRTFLPPFSVATDPCAAHGANCSASYADLCDTYDNALALTLLSMVGEASMRVARGGRMTTAFQSRVVSSQCSNLAHEPRVVHRDARFVNHAFIASPRCRRNAPSSPQCHTQSVSSRLPPAGGHVILTISFPNEV